MELFFGDWILVRPLGSLAFILPLLLVLLGLLPQRPRQQVTGTLGLWRLLEDGASGGARSRRLPLSRWLLALALCLGAAALAGPRQRRGEAAEAWTIVMDRSPSMYLPDAAGGVSRMARALERVDQWLAGRSSLPDLEWVAPGPGGLERVVSARPPEGWLSPPPAGLQLPELDLPRWDLPGVIVITDVAPGWGPSGRPSGTPRGGSRTGGGGGIIATGAQPVAGPVADGADGQLFFDGEGLALQPSVKRGVQVIGLPRVLQDLVGAWAGERGLEVLRQGGPSRVLLVSSAPADSSDGQLLELEAVAAGWSIRGTGDDLRRHTPLEGGVPWLLDAEGRVLVEHAPGVVRVGLVELEEPLGDPLSFVLSWSELLDGAVLPSGRVVPLAERRRSGAAVEWLPEEGTYPLAETGGPRPAGRLGLEALLAAGCAVLAVLSRLLRGG